MRFIGARLRATAIAGLAVSAVLTLSPAAAVAHAAPAQTFVPADLIPADLSAANPFPTDLLPTDLFPMDFVATDVLPASIGPIVLPDAVTRALTAATSKGLKGAAAKVVAEARSHLGARYRWGTQGPRTFDCSGLVLRAYADAGVLARIGGWANRSGYSMYRWAKRHHLASRTGGRPGDVVVWGGGAHVGIYLGHGMAISALVRGVRITSLNALTNRFTAFIHTGLASVPGPRVARLIVSAAAQ